MKRFVRWTVGLLAGGTLALTGCGNGGSERQKGEGGDRGTSVGNPPSAAGGLGLGLADSYRTEEGTGGGGKTGKSKRDAGTSGMDAGTGGATDAGMPSMDGGTR